MKKVGVDDYLLKNSVKKLLHLPRVNSNHKIFEDIKMAHKRWKNKKELLSNIEHLPAIDVSDKHLPDITHNVWEAIAKANRPIPTLFSYASALCRIDMDEKGMPFIRELDEQRCRLEISKRARFYFISNKGKIGYVYPPAPVIGAILASAEQLVPRLKRLVRTPVFSEKGKIETAAGYKEDTGLYYAPLPSLEVPSVSKWPTSAEVQAARNLILHELFCDFPFESEADKAYAFALFLLHPARDLIKGQTPLHLLDAPMQGTGKTLLADVIMRVWMGDSMPVITEGRNEEDWRKRVFSTLRKSPSFVLIDNLKARLESAALEAALTAKYFEDRVLGVSENRTLQGNCIWVATGNNILVSSEIARRSVRLRLNAGIDQPWLREKFKHPKLKMYADTHRGKLIHSALTIIQAWIAKGMPKHEGKKLGSFEAWSEIMGGILKFADVPGFLNDGSLRRFYEEADMELQIHEHFVGRWHDQYKLSSVPVHQLLDIAKETALIEDDERSDKSFHTRLGLKLSKLRGRVIEGFMIEKAGSRAGMQMWRLVRHGSASQGPKGLKGRSSADSDTISVKPGKTSSKVLTSSSWKKAQEIFERSKRRVQL